MKTTSSIPGRPAPAPLRARIAALAACALGLVLPSSAWSQPFTDDFSGATDTGWVHYDVLKAVGGTAGTFEVVNGVYHLHAPPSPNPAYGAARVAAYRPEVYTDFTVGADFTAWDAQNRNQFGVFGRFNNPGLGRTGGYLLSYLGGDQPTDNWLAIHAMKGEAGYTLAERLDLVLDPGHQYRLVLTGVGQTLVGELFDLANPGVAMATLTGYDWLYGSGNSGVALLANKSGGSGDLLVDNFLAGVGSGLPAKPAQPKDAPVRFLDEQIFGTGPFPGWIDQGDFNGDGFIDLVLPNNSGNSVSVLLNRGDGALKPKVDYPAGSGSTFVKVADLNGDGVLDLAVANAKTTTVSVLLGNGDGTFKAKVDYDAGPKPYSIAAGDLNKDGRMDLVLANNNTNKISVLLGNGDGTFQARTEYTVGNLPNSVRLLDLNGDGVLDVAVANGGETNIGVLLSNGDGTLQAMVAYPTEVAPGDLQVGDFNGDGHMDLVTINHDAERVMVLLSQGNGTLGAPLVKTGFNHGRALALGDLNRDGKLDLVVGTDAISKVYVLLGNNDGTFQDTMLPHRVYGQVIAATVADLNGDGFPDVALANSLDDRVQVLLADPAVTDDFADGNADGWFRYDPLATAGGTPSTFEIRDGAYHLHLAPTFNAAYGQARVGAFYPTNSFTDFEVAADVIDWDTTQTQFGLVGRGRNLALGQAEGYCFTYQAVRGRLMIITIRGEQGYTLTRQDLTPPLDPSHDYRFVFTGAGEYLVGKVYDLTEGGALVVTQVARDTTFTAGLSGVLATTTTLPLGTADVTFDNYSAKVGVITAPELAINPAPALAFSALGSYRTGNNPWGLAAGDFNGDGIVDIINVNNPSKTVSVLLGNGDGTLQAKKDAAVQGSPQFVAVADFNGDQKLDAAVANMSSNSVSVLIGKGDGTFQSKVDYPAADRPVNIQTADLNHDQIFDLVINTYGPSGATGAAGFSVLLGNADGTFQPKVDYAANNADGFEVVDLNGDTHSDLVAADAGSVGVWLGRGDGTFGAETKTLVSAGSYALAIGDFNGDGKPDVALSDSDRNAVHVLLGSGDGSFGEARRHELPAPGFLVAGDLDGDGKTDLVVASRGGVLDARGRALQQLRVWKGMGNGHFETPGTLIRTIGFQGPVILSDLNGDQRFDIAFINRADFFAQTLLNQGPVANAQNRLELSWPTGAPGFVIQGATDLKGEWTDLPGIPRIGHGPASTIQVERAAGAQFFRLRQAP